VTCPACRRIEGGYPAGFVTVRGSFFEEHREEILNLIRNTAEAEKAEHPLERLIAVQEEADAARLTTTGVHLARRIGDALARAYQGGLTLRYGEAEQRLRVLWER
jgi:hypothetical protein